MSYSPEIEQEEQGRASSRSLPADTVATVSVPCGRPSCGSIVPPQVSRRGERKVYCSPDCRRRHWDELHPRVDQARQRVLPLDPEPQPVPPVVDQRLDLAEEEKLRGDNALVLRRLRCGPATTADLAQAAPRSMAIHSRVADVRAYLKPLGETVTRRRLGPRLHRYQIESKR